LLLCLLAIPTGIRTFLIGNYWLNRSEYAVRYCENRATGNMQCQGSCHMRKQMESFKSQEATSEQVPQVALNLPEAYSERFIALKTDNDSLRWEASSWNKNPALSKGYFSEPEIPPEKDWLS